MSTAVAHIAPEVREAVAHALPELARALGRKRAAGAAPAKVDAILKSLAALERAVWPGQMASPTGWATAFERGLDEASQQPASPPTSAETEPRPTLDLAGAQIGTPILDGILGGRARVVFVPGKVIETGRYALIPRSRLIASHHPDCSANAAHSIAAAQPRDRSSQELCRQADKIAAALDPSVIASKAPTAFDGPPVVNTRGEVIQGNGRAIALRVAYERYPEQAAAYQRHLRANLAEWDLPPFAVDKVGHPVLVRVLDVTDARAVELGNVLNTAEAEQAPLDRAKALVRQLSPERRAALGRELAALMAAAGDDATLRAALDLPAAVQLLDFLPGLDRTGLLQNGQLTPKAKDLLRDVLVGLLFDDGSPASMARYDALSHTARAGIERAIGSLVALVGTEHDLGPRLRSAAEIVRRAGTTGGAARRAADVIRQADAFDAAAFSADDEALADLLLQAKTQKEVAERLRTYAVLAEGYTSLFESVPPQSPAEAYRRAFVEKMRLNPTGADLAYLGLLDALDVDGDGETIRFEEDGAPVYLFATPRGRLLAVPARRVRPVRGPVGGDGAALYETWAGRAEDADAFEVDLDGTEALRARLPQNGRRTQLLGTGRAIQYRSDKLIEPGDRKGKVNHYHHDFDAGRRPVYETGDVLVITDLAIDRRGILN